MNDSIAKEIICKSWLSAGTLVSAVWRESSGTVCPAPGRSTRGGFRDRPDAEHLCRWPMGQKWLIFTKDLSGLLIIKYLHFFQYEYSNAHLWKPFSSWPMQQPDTKNCLNIDFASFIRLLSLIILGNGFQKTRTSRPMYRLSENLRLQMLKLTF